MQAGVYFRRPSSGQAATQKGSCIQPFRERVTPGAEAIMLAIEFDLQQGVA